MDACMDTCMNRPMTGREQVMGQLENLRARVGQLAKDLTQKLDPVLIEESSAKDTPVRDKEVRTVYSSAFQSQLDVIADINILCCHIEDLLPRIDV